MIAPQLYSNTVECSCTRCTSPFLGAVVEMAHTHWSSDKSAGSAGVTKLHLSRSVRTRRTQKSVGRLSVSPRTRPLHDLMTVTIAPIGSTRALVYSHVRAVPDPHSSVYHRALCITGQYQIRVFEVDFFRLVNMRLTSLCRVRTAGCHNLCL